MWNAEMLINLSYWTREMQYLIASRILFNLFLNLHYIDDECLSRREHGAKSILVP